MDSQDLVLRKIIQKLVGPRPGAIPTVLGDVDRWVANARKQVVLTEHITRMKGVGLAWDDLRFPATNLRRDLAKPPTETSLQGVFPVLAFAQAAENRVGGIAQHPHDWSTPSKIEVHVHWTPASNKPGEYVVWRLGYAWAPIRVLLGDGEFPALTNVKSDPVEGLLSGANGDHVYTHIAYIDPPDTILHSSVSSILLWSLYRDGGVGDDNYTDDALLIEFDIHYQRDGFGSAEIDSKGRN